MVGIHDGSSKGKTKSKTKSKMNRKTTQIRILTLNTADIMATLQSPQRSISYASPDILVTVYNQRFQPTLLRPTRSRTKLPR